MGLGRAPRRGRSPAPRGRPPRNQPQLVEVVEVAPPRARGVELGASTFERTRGQQEPDPRQVEGRLRNALGEAVERRRRLVGQTAGGQLLQPLEGERVDPSHAFEKLAAVLPQVERLHRVEPQLEHAGRLGQRRLQRLDPLLDFPRPAAPHRLGHPQPANPCVLAVRLDQLREDPVEVLGPLLPQRERALGELCRRDLAAVPQLVARPPGVGVRVGAGR